MSPFRNLFANCCWAFAVWCAIGGGLMLAAVAAAVGFAFWTFGLDGDDSPWRRLTRPWR